MERHNDLGQPIGPALAGWTPPPMPAAGLMEGRFCRLEPLDADRHAADLYAANQRDAEGRSWTYLPYGPFKSIEVYRDWIHSVQGGPDPRFFVIIPKAVGKALGVASYLRIIPAAGSIEVGHIHYGEALRRSTAATEAMVLMMTHAFALGYRRYEWKCDALNAPSRAAAERLGFQFEGIFRQATVYKERSRDTAWYAIIDKEWPQLRATFETWLAPDNFDGHGRQRVGLRQLMRRVNQYL